MLNRSRALKVLFTTPILQYPAVGGPYLRIENSIKALSKVADLYIYSQVYWDAFGGDAAILFYKQYCKRFYFPPHTKVSRFAKRAINFFSRRILKTEVFALFPCSAAAMKGLLAVADSIKADLIWLGYGNISYSLLKYIKSNSTYRVVLDTDSVWSRFVLRRLPFAEDGADRKRIEKAGREKEEEERWGTQLADVTTAVSEVDAQYYRKLGKYPEQIQLFSNAIDLENYRLVPPPVNLKKPSLYLAGTFGPRSPMDDAARWVIQEVLPLVRKQIPRIHFYIIGTRSDTTLSDVNGPGVTITGRLPSVLPYLCHADVALVPLRFESGTRFKILEAGACGIPVVSTTLGAEGLPLLHGKDILLADDPKSFADSIVRLIRDRDYSAGQAENLKALVHEKYSISSLAEEAHVILDHLMGNPNS